MFRELLGVVCVSQCAFRELLGVVCGNKEVFSETKVSLPRIGSSYSEYSQSGGLSRTCPSESKRLNSLTYLSKSWLSDVTENI